MEFEHSEPARALIAKLEGFMDQWIYPAEAAEYAWNNDPVNQWRVWPGLAELQAKARAAGLWNLFLPKDYGAFSPGLSNLDYAPLAEIMGRVPFSPEVFNCSAPDTGNMEVLARFGTADQQRQWLRPLMDGEIRSAFLMTEPAVASSDATNVATTMVADGEHYVIHGRKWWSSGVMDPRCKMLLVMGKTNPTAKPHQQQSIVIVPRDTPGVRVLRSMPALGWMHSPGGEGEVLLDGVRVPRENLILGAGRGFEVAQGRLGPGRIHHCMRSIGQAQRALELMARRVEQRVAFGRKLAEQGSIRQDVALSFCEIEQARLLTLKAADQLDRHGNKVAKDLIAAIKIVAPRMALKVLDRAIQAHGGMGLNSDTPLAYAFAINRFLRIADGPDEVHMAQLGKAKIAEYNQAPPRTI